jgi:uncharacterized protein YkwD
MPSRAAIALITVFLSAACFPATVRTKRDPPATERALERAIFARVNRHRRAIGLPALADDSTIARHARLHSAAMAAGTTPLGHTGFADRAATLRRVMAARRTAENVAFNQGHRDPAAVAVQGWLESPGHRENIEGPYELTGVGVASNAKGEVYFTQIFVGR